MKKFYFINVVLLFLALNFIQASNFEQINTQTQTDSKRNFKNTFLYGVTIDDSWYDAVKLSGIINTLKSMPSRPVVRIVMSKDTHPSDYVQMFKKINEVAYIMATPVDSYEMKSYKDIKSYKKRFEDSYNNLAPYVKIWEVANEINGEGWLGDDLNLIVDKMNAAYEFILSKNALSALTLYYTPPNFQKIKMLDWVERYASNNIKQNIDYVFVSYYEDDNGGFLPDWKNIFDELQVKFPNSKLGIGECGNVSKDANKTSKVNMAKRYYNMPKFNENFIGGYFWWYFVQDCVMDKNDELLFEIHKAMRAKK
ncbi:hypothetical protein [Campylobacter sp. RM15925]|uniref:hypothetical protein n=1 Tax=Campylobacter sp. RM15925 TaxID=1705724 RepID=UPI0014737F1B|nr:hypothetical protein [Campylobacter sp. RM15925]